MDLSVEETNYMKITKIVIETIPKYLRRCFIQQWNLKYPKKKWKSNNASGIFLFNQLPDKIKNNKSNEMSIDKIKTGNEQLWDTSTLVLVMLNSGLKLIKGVRPSKERSTPLRISEEIDVIRDIRNLHFAHASNMSCSSDDFTKIMTDIKSTARNIFSKDAEKEIDEIENFEIETSIATELKRELEIEINTNKEFGTEFSETLKARYKNRYDKHEIHIVSKGSIVLDMKKIHSFYMKLKISPDLPPEDTFKAEALRQSEILKHLSDDDIDISQLADKECDITFVCGSAGIGKTVLAKKLACGWANGELYKGFNWCIMFECKDINYFQATGGANGKDHELISNFLEARFAFDFVDGSGMLIIIDGLDELNGVRANDSIIRQLLELTCSKYTGSKMIITGRPHIEEALSRNCRKMCSVQKVEIHGMCDEQVQEYVNKFNSCESDVVDIRKAKDFSNRYLAIMHVPQFLNTFCCVLKLLKEDSVCNAELYCWTLYLFLSQHGDKLSSNEKRIDNVFEKYSKSLVTLGSICFNLIIKNALSLEGEIKLELGNNDIANEFLESLYVDASDIYKKKYQFKHLSLLEFLSALFVCTCKARMRIIEDLLEKGLTEVVHFILQMVEGFTIDGSLRKSLLQAVNFRPPGSRNFCNDVAQALQKCMLDDQTSFKHSLDVAHYSAERNAARREVTSRQSNAKKHSVKRSATTSGITDFLRSAISSLKRRLPSMSNLNSPDTPMTSSVRLSASTPNLSCRKESPTKDAPDRPVVFNVTDENDNPRDRPDVLSEAIHSNVSAELQSFPWFVGIMNTREANARLQYHENGTFLVRESITQDRPFFLSIIYNKEPKHIMIEARNGFFSISSSVQFRAIPDIIEFYMQHSLSHSYPSIPTVLTGWVPTQDVVVALRPYDATNRRELSFQKDARISVINRDGNWWYGKLDGKLGFFPKNYVQDAPTKS